MLMMGRLNRGKAKKWSEPRNLLRQVGFYLCVFQVLLCLQLIGLLRWTQREAIEISCCQREFDDTTLRLQRPGAAPWKNRPAAPALLTQTTKTTSTMTTARIARQAASMSSLMGYGYHETWNGAAAAASRTKTIDQAVVVPPTHEWLLDNPPMRNQTSVPKVIYKTFLSNAGILPDFQNQSSQLQEAHESWILKNPGYELRYFDLMTMRQYLGRYFHPVFLRAFDCIEAYAGKNNVFRAAVLYREGGWYSDWKEVCLVDGLLDELSTNNRTLVVPLDRGTPYSRQNRCVMNAFFGATERHPMLQVYLGLALQNVQKSYYGPTPQSNTGPCVMGEALIAVAKIPAVINSLRIFRYRWNDYKIKKRKVAQHKCIGCESSWDEVGGNDYRELHDKGLYYCRDAQSILLGL